MPLGTVRVKPCLNIQFVHYYMGISYFLYYLTHTISATVISVHAKAHYGRAKITQCGEICSPPRKCGLGGSNPGIDSIRGLSLLLVLFAPRGFSLGTLVFPSPQKPTFPDSSSTRNGRQRTKMWMCYL